MRRAWFCCSASTTRKKHTDPEYLTSRTTVRYSSLDECILEIPFQGYSFEDKELVGTLHAPSALSQVSRFYGLS